MMLFCTIVPTEFAISFKVHVSKEKMEKFKNVADICSFFTEDPSETKIHACSWVVSR